MRMHGNDARAVGSLREDLIKAVARHRGTAFCQEHMTRSGWLFPPQFTPTANLTAG